MMDINERWELCKDDFYYFNYALIDRERRMQHSTPIGRGGNYAFFFDDSNMPFIFKLYSQFENEGIYLVEQQEIGVGFTNFCCYLSYYTIFTKPSTINYVCDAKLIKELANKIIDLTFYFKGFTQIDATYYEIYKSVMFSNGSKITFYTDTTYDFRNESKKNDLLIFDNAKMKNFDKLVYILESIINGKITDKVIINFNNIPPLFHGSENYNYLTTNFKNYIKLITVKK